MNFTSLSTCVDVNECGIVFMRSDKNLSKFQALCVSKAVNPHVLELFIDGIIVRSEPRVKLFGIHIDQCLTFTYHTTEMCKKANSQAQACPQCWTPKVSL